MATKINTELNLSNTFIQSKFTLEAMEIKLLYAIAYKLQNGYNGSNIIDLTKEYDDDSVYYTANEIASFLGIQKNAYHHFYRLCKSLMSKNISVKDSINQKFKMLSFLIEAEYNDGVLKLVPNPRANQFYMSLTTNYTRLELVQVLRMKSIYAIRIYSLIKMKAQQYKHIYVVEIDELKEYLGIDKQYSRMNNLKVRVLEPAKEELNKIIPQLKFNYDFLKQGKSYKKIRFVFNGNELEYTMLNDELYSRTMKKFISECKGGKFCTPNGSEECQYCIMKVKKRHE